MNLFDTFVGVVALIEARSNTENRFEGISKQMEMLGATVSHTCILQIQNCNNPCYMYIQFQQPFPILAFGAHQLWSALKYSILHMEQPAIN